MQIPRRREVETGGAPEKAPCANQIAKSEERMIRSTERPIRYGDPRRLLLRRPIISFRLPRARRAYFQSRVSPGDFASGEREFQASGLHI